MISSFLVSLHSYELQKQLSRYGGVPVGNISQDVLGFLETFTFREILHVITIYFGCPAHQIQTWGVNNKQIFVSIRTLTR